MFRPKGALDEGELTPLHISVLRKLLLERRDLLVNEIAAQRRRPLQELADGPRGARDVDEAVADAVKNVRALEIQRDVEEVEAVERALRRIDDGTYGTCATCGCEIAYDRLKAHPAATRCVDCQRLREHTYRQPRTASL